MPCPSRVPRTGWGFGSKDRKATRIAVTPVSEAHSSIAIGKRFLRNGRASLPKPLCLRSGKSIEQDLQGSPATALIGPLVEMRCALWIPVARDGRLRGVLLAATRAKNEALPRAGLEAVAA